MHIYLLDSCFIYICLSSPCLRTSAYQARAYAHLPIKPVLTHICLSSPCLRTSAYQALAYAYLPIQLLLILIYLFSICKDEMTFAYLSKLRWIIFIVMHRRIIDEDLFTFLGNGVWLRYR